MKALTHIELNFRKTYASYPIYVNADRAWVDTGKLIIDVTGPLWMLGYHRDRPKAPDLYNLNASHSTAHLDGLQLIGITTNTPHASVTHGINADYYHITMFVRNSELLKTYISRKVKSRTLLGFEADPALTLNPN